jgi:uncharacterized protein (DUF1778 family)
MRKNMRVSNVVPKWYHFTMAMNLRLSPEQSEALKKAAAEDGISMQEAALRAIDSYTSRRREKLLKGIEKIKTQDAELLRRLAK